jgi:hypothetical protein
VGMFVEHMTVVRCKKVFWLIRNLKVKFCSAMPVFCFIKIVDSNNLIKI